MEETDYGETIAEVRGCRIASVDHDDSALMLTLVGGEGWQLVAGVKRLEFYNDSLTFDASIGIAEYDRTTRSLVDGWAAVEAEVGLICKEKVSILFDPLSLMAVLLPGMDVNTNWDGFFAGSPAMN